MQRFLYILLIFVTFGCSKKISDADLKQLNGYWEIENVTFSDGSTKTYNVNTTVDYIEIDGFEGYRKKVKPKFDGTYDTSNDAEFFTIEKKNDSFVMYYQNNLSEWSESLTQLSQTNFAVIGENNSTYHYRRYEPINIQK
ncbi:hypothetical protein [uncultured Kriegella sp.]|uniref:hypothetical protein n=1 Tax=uncultured Kriegella sp. TaxID=1798910 RepID=UPI0030D82366|tara:strand:+ start:263284 stop:263703 length:420 start_codon:yes stop_codon:yes gene_type:complete